MEATPSNATLLTTEKLVKEYRTRRVVNGVSVNVSAGEIVGLDRKSTRLNSSH